MPTCPLAATDQSVDAVFDRCWRRRLRLRHGRGQPDDVGVELAVESVIADTEARRATWSPCRRSCLTAPADVVLPATRQVSREEWSLLALVDGGAA
jgi:hypothetical protein